MSLMKNYALALICTATMLLCKSLWANEPYCASPDITPTMYDGAVAQYVTFLGGLVFYVTPEVDARFHADIKEAAKVWNQHLPQGAQIEITFSKDEWRRKTNVKSGKVIALILEHASHLVGFLARTLRDRTGPTNQDHNRFVPSGTIGPTGIDPLLYWSNRGIEHDTAAYAKPFFSQIFINNRDHHLVNQITGTSHEEVFFYEIILHEMGHTLGLDHNDQDPSSIMTRYSDKPTKALARLSGSDVRAIRCAYGMAPLEHFETPKLESAPEDPLLNDVAPPKGDLPLISYNRDKVLKILEQIAALESEAFNHLGESEAL